MLFKWKSSSVKVLLEICTSQNMELGEMSPHCNFHMHLKNGMLATTKYPKIFTISILLEFNCVTQWVFILDHRVFVLDQWVFILDHRDFSLWSSFLGLCFRHIRLTCENLVTSVVLNIIIHNWIILDTVEAEIFCLSKGDFFYFLLVIFPSMYVLRDGTLFSLHSMNLRWDVWTFSPGDWNLTSWKFKMLNAQWRVSELFVQLLNHVLNWTSYDHRVCKKYIWRSNQFWALLLSLYLTLYCPRGLPLTSKIVWL